MQRQASLMLLTLHQLLLVGVFLFTACVIEGIEAPYNPNSKNKILNLGASRAAGARPVHESYRYELWKDLIDNHWEFDFIGTKEDYSFYPAYGGLAFDKDHEARPGWTSFEILDGLPKWLEETGSPDIVLFSTPGGNDALLNLDYSKTIKHIHSIVDTLQANNPKVTILIEQMAPPRSTKMEPPLSTYVSNLQQDVVSIAAQKSNDSSLVIAVDMYTGFSDSLLKDGVHYNELGARFIAERYYEVLQTVLIR
jgi:hypothetical protein